ncbi:hypothetical protein D3C80_1594470 [compost metagenome]
MHIKHDHGVFVGNDRKDEVGHDEQVRVGHNQSHEVGHNRTLFVGANHKVTIGNDHQENIGNDRHDTVAANHESAVGGDSTHTVNGHHALTAGQGMQRTTTVYQLQASERLVIQGPGGSITLDEQGIHLNGLEITLQGPVNATAPGSGKALALHLVPEAGLTCTGKIR